MFQVLLLFTLVASGIQAPVQTDEEELQTKSFVGEERIDGVSVMADSPERQSGGSATERVQGGEAKSPEPTQDNFAPIECNATSPELMCNAATTVPAKAIAMPWEVKAKVHARSAASSVFSKQCAIILSSCVLSYVSILSLR